MRMKQALEWCQKTPNVIGQGMPSHMFAATACLWAKECKMDPRPQGCHIKLQRPMNTETKMSLVCIFLKTHKSVEGKMGISETSCIQWDALSRKSMTWNRHFTQPGDVTDSMTTINTANMHGRQSGTPLHTTKLAEWSWFSSHMHKVLHMQEKLTLQLQCKYPACPPPKK